jgi:hypothetical protein
LPRLSIPHKLLNFNPEPTQGAQKLIRHIIAAGEAYSAIDAYNAS